MLGFIASCAADVVFPGGSRRKRRPDPVGTSLTWMAIAGLYGVGMLIYGANRNEVLLGVGCLVFVVVAGTLLYWDAKITRDLKRPRRRRQRWL